MRTLVLYDRNFNITKELSKRVSLVIDEAISADINTFNEDLSRVEFIVLGILYNKKLQISRFIQFINEYSDYILERRVIIIIFSKENRKQFKDLNLIKDKLSDALVDVKTVTYSREDVVTLASSLNEKMKEYKKIENLEDILSDIEDFLEDKTGGILATGHNKNIRATPVELIYHNKFFYIFGKTGEKFANLIIDNYVSLCIIEDLDYYLQVSGKGFLVGEFTEEYNEILNKKIAEDTTFSEKLKYYNLLKVTPFKIELYDKQYEEEGYNAKQIYY